MSRLPIYLDYQATTPLDPRVKEAMGRYEHLYGNPHTTSHLAGTEAARAVTRSRRQLAKAIQGDARRVVFTSGATEANNLALFGIARAARGKRKIITVESEHSSVLEPALALRDEGVVVEVLPVGKDGLVDLDDLERAVDTDTILVSVMHVNNETGVIQPVAHLAEIAHSVGAKFHSDCAQSLGRVNLKLADLGADLITLSSHKTYGPKGIGALYIGGSPTVQLQPLFFGGGQEKGIRPGTLPVPLCVGFGEACSIAAKECQQNAERANRLANNMFSSICAAFPEVRLNGSQETRAPGVFNLCFPGLRGEELLSAFDGIQVSSGSACSSTTEEPSRVLLSYGLSPADADSSLRFSVGRFTTENDIKDATAIIERGLRKLGFSQVGSLERSHLKSAA